MNQNYAIKIGNNEITVNIDVSIYCVLSDYFKCFRIAEEGLVKMYIKEGKYVIAYPNLSDKYGKLVSCLECLISILYEKFQVPFFLGVF